MSCRKCVADVVRRKLLGVEIGSSLPSLVALNMDYDVRELACELCSVVSAPGEVPRKF